jgi:CubicO group peptidase (beta-lactamase class C family)
MLNPSVLEQTFNAAIPEALAAESIPGGVLLVGWREGKGFREWSKAYGLKQIEPEPLPMPLDAVFDLASVTKPVATGTSLMILIERGDANLDDPVVKYLPCFKGEGKSEVTVRDLMSHCSGLAPSAPRPERQAIVDRYGMPCPNEIREFVCRLPLTDGPPRTRIVYSCLSAILSAEILRAVTGKEINEFAWEHVFGPLRMGETGFNPEANLRERAVPTTRSEWNHGEFLRGKVHDPLSSMQGGVSGNAGLFSTGQDLGRFARMMLNEGELDGVRILQPETVRLATSEHSPPHLRNRDGEIDRMGLLWRLYSPVDNEQAPVIAYGHDGYTGTSVRIYPEHGIYVIALSNRVHPNDTSTVNEFRRMLWKTIEDHLGCGR